MIDRYPGQTSALTAPSDRWVLVEPSTDLLAELPKFLVCPPGDPVTVALEGSDGVVQAFYLQPGQALHVRPRRFLVDGTDESAILIACL